MTDPVWHALADGGASANGNPEDPVGGMSVLFSHHAALDNYAGVITGAFMIVDSPGHYLTGTVHDHGPSPDHLEVPGLFMLMDA